MTDQTSSPLSRIALYHRLRRCSARLALRTRILRFFTAADGALLEYPVARRARIVTGTATLSGEGDLLSLLSVRVATTGAMALGAMVVLEIESWAPHRWYAFRARVSEVDVEGRLKLQLVQFAGRTRASSALNAERGALKAARSAGRNGVHR